MTRSSRFRLLSAVLVLLAMGWLAKDTLLRAESDETPMPYSLAVVANPAESGNSRDIRGITFATIPGGSFQMGSPDSPPCISGGLRIEDNCGEAPVHTVTITGFEMSECEITASQYAAYLNTAITAGEIEVKYDNANRNDTVYGKIGVYAGKRYLDMGFDGCQIVYANSVFSVLPGYENRPVVMVSWHGAKAFALYYGIDLPTEAEWEYACRGGRQYEYGTDDGTISASKANYGKSASTVPVGSYPANPYGLHDMSGNVWEWCHDPFERYTSNDTVNPTGALSGEFRVLRGGSCRDSDNLCRSTNRTYSGQSNGREFWGFRVVRRTPLRSL